MPTRPPMHRPFAHEVDADTAYEQRRGSSRDRGYSPAWERARVWQLGAHPLCAYCLLDDRVTPATLVDHLIPHRGNMDLFWRRDLWVSSCTACHAGFKQQVEVEGMSALRALAARLGVVIP